MEQRGSTITVAEIEQLKSLKERTCSALIVGVKPRVSLVFVYVLWIHVIMTDGGLPQEEGKGGFFWRKAAVGAVNSSVCAC